MTDRKPRRPSAATVIALIALFVALDGPVHAAKLIRGSQIKSSTITGRHIKNSTLTTSDIKNRTLKTSDISTSTVALLRQTPANSVNGAAIIDRTVGNADLAANSVGQGKIINGSVTATELAPNAVTGASVADGSLTAADVTRFAGSFELDFPSIDAHACVGLNPEGLAPQTQNFDLSKDLIVGAQPAAWPDGLTFDIHRAANFANRIRVNVCNPTDAPIDPPAGQFKYAVLAL